jgi:hypothetical protein
VNTLVQPLAQRLLGGSGGFQRRDPEAFDPRRGASFTGSWQPPVSAAATS